MAKNKEARITMRIDAKTKAQFDWACRKQGTNMSTVLESYINYYINRNKEEK